MSVDLVLTDCVILISYPNQFKEVNESMPNWVFSKLTVKGTSERLKEFREYSKAKDDGSDFVLSANKYVPVPEQLLNGKCNDCGYSGKDIIECHQPCPKCNSKNTVDWFNNGGYEWCIEHWGTKWGFVNPQLIDDDCDNECDEIQYEFETAWSPILPVIEMMAIKFPDLIFIYQVEEESSSFAGYYILKDRKIVDRTIDLYNIDKDIKEMM